MDYVTEAVVVGAGVVGLAIGRALAQAGIETVILERGAHIGEETSSRNSEVIHAGIYYPRGSIKAQTCVRGKALLYDYAQSHQIPFNRCGKLLVARDSAELPALEIIREGARRCGVEDLQALDGAALRELEPELEGACGLLSPSTGIIDSHQFMLSLQGEFAAAGGMLALQSPLEGGELASGGLHRLR
ncbi:MAG: FAD-dependent oxidoreductase, partial [Halioglobus sp.]|nr:FAD-dependent oxidoreductase [Halioglobus sp.]